MVILVFGRTATNTLLSLVIRASQLIWSRFSPNALSPIPQRSFVPPMISVNRPEAPIHYLLHKKRSKKNSIRPPITLSSCLSEIPASKLVCSRSLPYAGAWLTAVTMKGLGLYLLTAEFQAAVRYRIGLPVFASARRYPVCPSGILDVLGDDVFACGRNRGRITGQGILNLNVTTAATLAPFKDQRNLIRGERSKTGDIFVPTWNAVRQALLASP